MVLKLRCQDMIDTSYYDKLVDDAVETVDVFVFCVVLELSLVVLPIFYNYV